MLIDMNALAMMGAKARLAQLQAEAEEIRRMFPDLRSTTATARPGRAAAAENAGSPRRKPMSAADKRAVSARMTKYWASRRQAKAAGDTGTAAPAGGARKRTISPEGRARIAEAQKKRWAAARKASKGTQGAATSEQRDGAAPTPRGGRKRSAKRGTVKREVASAAAAR